MKTLLLPILFFLLSPFVSLGQNWAPMVPGARYHYLSQSDSIVHSLWVDSTRTGNADTLFLNRRSVECDVCAGPNEVYRGMRLGYPHFLMKEWQVYGDSLWFLADTQTFQIFPRAGLGESWAFGYGPNTIMQVTVTAVFDSLVWGQWDSIKVLSLNTGGNIQLSQHHGILSFPDFSDLSNRYTLIGVEGNGGTFGLHPPSYQDYFQYEVGDELEYYQESRAYRGLEEGAVGVQTKWQIQEKSVSADSTVYTVNWIKKTIHYHWYTEEVEFVYVSQGVDTQLYVFSDPHPLNAYSFEMRTYPGYDFLGTCTVDSPGEVFASTYLRLGPDSVIRHEVGRHIDEAINLNEWGFYTNWNDSTLKATCAQYYWEQFSPPIGRMQGGLGWHEIGAAYELVGAVISGDTTGMITPDSVLTSMEETGSSFVFEVYPNPASDVLHISWNPQQWDGTPTLTLLNMQGQKVLQRSLQVSDLKAQLEVSSLPKGLYVLRMEGNQLLQRKIAIE